MKTLTKRRMPALGIYVLVILVGLVDAVAGYLALTLLILIPFG